MIKGVDYLGGVNYIKAITNGHRDGAAAGFLCYATGWKNGIKAARALAATGKCPVMRIHGCWKDGHKFLECDIKNAVRQAEKVAKLKEDFPGIKIFFSPWLEPGTPQHPISEDLMRKCKRACGKVLPKQIRLVAGMPMAKGTIECHGDSTLYRSPYLWSFDGKDMWKSDVKYWLDKHKRAIACFGWGPDCNGKKFLTDSTPRENRTNWPNAVRIKEYFLELGK